MIQYVPIEFAPAEGHDLYFILCIWVHGHKQGRGNLQKRGMGKGLLAAAEQDARELGGKGMVAWGLGLPFWMRASWFRRHGYEKVDRLGIQLLLWKPFCETAQAPKWLRQQKTPPPLAGRVSVTACLNGWCPGMNIAYERARRVAAEFGDRVTFTTVDTFDRQTMLAWGLSDALFIDGREVRIGPPPSCGKLRRLMAKRVKKLGAAA
jgi:hypothetical protein